MTDARRRQAREHDARRADAAEAAIRRIDAAGTKAAAAIMAAMREAMIAAGLECDITGYVDEFVADRLSDARNMHEAEMEAAGFDWPDRPNYTTGAETPPTSPLPRSAT